MIELALLAVAGGCSLAVMFAVHLVSTINRSTLSVLGLGLSEEAKKSLRDEVLRDLVESAWSDLKRWPRSYVLVLTLVRCAGLLMTALPLRKHYAALGSRGANGRRAKDELLLNTSALWASSFGEYESTLEVLVAALDARDHDTKGHSRRVARHMMDIAHMLGVKEGTEEWAGMYRGALLADVGKIGIPDSILRKSERLTMEEWAIYRKHPEIGYDILSPVSFLAGALDVVMSHHERWDGKGFPQGLQQKEIPLGARLFAVVDAFDSLTSDRPYRKAISATDAMSEIRKASGSQFDPLVVDAFSDIYDAWLEERSQQ